MKFTKQEVQELFELKVSRAVDRIFTQNKVDEIYEFYNCLQEYKKQNTLSLKKTLEHNYQKMLDCSEVMKKVSDYAQEIKKVAENIEDEVEIGQNHKNKGKKKNSNPILQIQTYIQHNSFLIAYNALENLIKSQKQIALTDRYYLKYLKIQIILRIQTYLSHHSLSKIKLTEIVQCLHLFIFSTSPSKLQKICCDYKNPSILFLIHKKLNLIKELKKQETYKFCYQIIFEEKLCLLTKQCKREKNEISSAPFENYFKDLLTVLNEASSDTTFCQIFINSIPNIKRQLSIIFITRSQTGQIIFNCDLYDHLVSSSAFNEILKQFHQKMISSGSSNIENPIVFIRQLWHDYLINLIDYSLEQFLPFTFCDQLQMYERDIDKIPPELKKFMYDRSKESSVKNLTGYVNKLKILNKNILNNFQRCTGEEKNIMRRKINEKIIQVNKKMEDKVQQYVSHPTLLTFRRFILLCFLIHSFFTNFEQINKKTEIWESDKIQSMRKIIKNHHISNYFKLFQLNNDDDLDHSFVDLDCFFVGYIENQPDKSCQNIIKDSIKQINIEIICGLQRRETKHHHREKDLLEHTLHSIQQGKEKVTVMDYILIPYVAKYVCDCKINQKIKDEQIWNKYFSGQRKNQKVQEKIDVLEEEEDDFEIGEKEENQEVVKIGKSLMNMGNSIISGLMMKKK